MADEPILGGEIVVTARKRAERLQDVPVAITAVGKAALDAYSITDIASVSKLAPQLQVSVGGPSGGAQLYLRGIGSTANSGFDPAVGLVIDGVFYNRTLWLTQSFVDMERVEVLKGPQTLYFGKNTPAGVVMVETSNPSNETEFGVKAGYEFEARERYAEAMASGPLSDTFGARIAVRLSDMDGWVKALGETRPAGDPNGLTLLAPSDRRLPNTRDLSGRLTLRWEPSSTFNTTLKVSGTKHSDAGLSANIQTFACNGPNNTAQPQFGVLSPLDDCKPSDSVERHDIPQPIADGWDGFKKGTRQFSTLDTFAVSLNSSLDFDWGNLNSITGYNWYELYGVGDASYSGTWQYIAFDNTKHAAFSQELRLLTTLDGPINFLGGGVRYTKEKKVSDKWNSFVNARVGTVFAPVDKHFAATTSAQNWSPQATISWHPVPDVTVYGSYKQGFKGGGYSFSSLLVAAITPEQLTFRPEKARGFELGAKGLFFDRALSLDVNVYNYLYTDLQVTAFDSATTAFSVKNAASARIKGIELSGNLRATDSVSLHGSVAYNHARFKAFLGQCYAGQTIQMGCDELLNPKTGAYTSQDLSGKRPPLAPDWNANFGALWRGRDIFGNMGLQIAVDGRYSSKYPLDSTNRPDMFQDDYVTLDASIKLLAFDERWSLALIGRNLTDEAIALTGSDRPGTGGPVGLDQSDPRAGRLGDGRGAIDRLRSIALQAEIRF